MKPPVEYRQPRTPASSGGRTADFGSAKPGSSPGAGAIPRYVVVGDAKLVQTDPSVITMIGDAAFVLAHKRKLKAEQMRRYRAKKAGK